MTARSGDARRSQVYEAEQLVIDMLDRGGLVQFHGERLVLEPDRKFGRVEDVQRYLDWLRQHEWAAPHTPAPVVRVRRGAAKAHWTAPGTIALPDAAWARRELIVLHEYAHHVVWHETDGTDSRHSARFCRTFAELVRQAVGLGPGLLLFDTFEAAGLLAEPPGPLRGVAGWPA